MAVSNPATRKKRQRELDQRESRQEKLQKQAIRKEKRKERDSLLESDPSVDPDLAGIIPGPHNNNQF